MTEGGIASWKKKDGESFIAGDVLLEIVRLLTLSKLILSSSSAVLGNG
jgi:pyruvate dehydrogenase E2 component (dihydrolipoamide acetyltransferase)